MPREHNRPFCAVPALLPVLGLLALLWQAGCRMETREIGREAGRLEKIRAAGKIVVGTSADYPPYEFRLLPDVDPEMVGIDIDIAEAIAANLNVKLEVRDIPFSRLFDELAAGNIDLALAGLAPTENRRRVADFSIPYYKAMQNMLVRAEDRERIKLVEDLRGKVVATQKGSIQEDLARNLLDGAVFFLHEEIDELIGALLRKEVDAVILEKPVAETYAARAPEFLLNLECDAQSQLLESAAAVRKGDAELLERVNQVLGQLIAGNKITESAQAAKVLANKI